MNTEKQTAANDSRPAPQRPPKAIRKRPNRKLMQGLRIAMLTLGTLILILGMLLVVLPLFRVQKVEIKGNQIHTTEEILAASGIRTGEDESLAINGNAVANRILEKCDYIDSCVVVTTPFSVTITVTEKENVKTASLGDKLYSFDGALCVIEVIENGETFASPFLHVILPPVSSIAEGKKIVFANAEADMTYIATLTQALKDADLMARVTQMDFSERTALSFILDGCYQIEFGNIQEIPQKVTMINTLLAEKTNGEDGAETKYAILNVSNPKASTYQPVDTLP